MKPVERGSRRNDPDSGRQKRGRKKSWAARTGQPCHGEEHDIDENLAHADRTPPAKPVEPPLSLVWQPRKKKRDKPSKAERALLEALAFGEGEDADA